MKKIGFNLFPGGRDSALVMSYDDGREADLRLLDIFNQHHIRGTFHLNSGMLGKPGYVTENDVRTLYGSAGHEISVHTVTHPFLTAIPQEAAIEEIREDKARLEALYGKPVRGMSYPFGAYNDEIVTLMQTLGMEYARTVTCTADCTAPRPADFLRWRPITHHNDQLLDKFKAYLFSRRPHQQQKLNLFYAWGHSYEFDNDQNWPMITEFCRFAGERMDVWFATQIEVVDYINALSALRFTADGSVAQNLSACDVWFTADGEKRCVKAGEIMPL